MRSRPNRYTIALLACLASAAGADSAFDARVSVANATVAPRPEHKQMLVPGDLEYAVEVSMRCSGQSEPESLSLGVADTRDFFDLADSADRSTLVSTFIVPGEQVAPVVTQGYCIQGDEESQVALQVDDILTMQLSLRCSDQSIHYLSQPLAVTINCVTRAVKQEGASRQDASPSER